MQIKNLIPFSVIIFLFAISCSKDKTPEIPTPAQNYTLSITNIEDWGGTPAPDTTQTHEPEFITVHHAGEDWKEGKKVEDYLINLQNWSRSEKNWIDIPYHYIIDLEGKIWEGRDTSYPGDTNTSYDPTGHILTMLVGNYENIKPTKDQIESLINLLTWQTQEFDIKPETLKAHKDYAVTACPGKNLYPYINNGYLLKEINLRHGKVKLIH